MSRERGRPLKPSDYAVLNALRFLGPMSYQEIKRLTNLPRGKLYDTLLRLRDSGLIGFELRGRSKIYHLTEAGRVALEKGVVMAGPPQVERKLSTEELIRVLTPSDAAVLKALIGGPKSTSELKDATGLKGQHVNLALQRLRSFGLIVTERKGLVQYHSLTEEGRAIAERAVKAVEARLEAERIIEGVLDRIVEAVRLRVSLGVIKRELRRYELELKERKNQETAKN
jgi:DNA-binding MarR family transcriptional regulator